MSDVLALRKIRHSAAHVLASAAFRLFPTIKFDIGPATETGFYYDFDSDHQFNLGDLALLEKEMLSIIGENQNFEKSILTRKEAEKLFSDKNQEYKLSRLADIPEGTEISIYKNGEFIDLCSGPHVANTSEIKAIKLLSVAGAYYRGNENNKQLQRIYGTAFDSQEALDMFLKQMEEAKLRDHRKIGKEMQLFMIDDEFGQGLILWLPNGTIIRNELQKFILSELEKRGYSQVITPNLAKLDIFRTSGHFPYYRDAQYPPIPERVALQKLLNNNATCKEMMDGLENGQLDGFLIKPMNCPGHIKIYASKARSYRELPVKLAEFGTVYRWEQSGELSGMTRVRGFTQDDAHIFCTEEQLGTEINECLELVQLIFKVLGMSDFRVRVSLRDEDSSKYIGSEKSWLCAEKALKQAAESINVPFTIEEGEAAFYGPKIDFVVKDVIGREWQLGTIQVDYNLPERFDLSYIGRDNKPHRPVMIHRAPFGSLERFCGVLIEHFGGNFPTWLAPEQVRILSVNDAATEGVKAIQNRLRKNGLRVCIDIESEKLGAKIRRAELDKVPYMFIVGTSEIENGTVSIRSRVNKSIDGTIDLEKILEIIAKEIQEKRLPSSMS
ncbi:MAG: threonine--tRNA ligase [Puniceicoccales bacterium]|jgi:threonyl-tRNA synthetase|nr:threonine--tRNA ligase [Puniceicoccales bacterium]